MSNPPVPIRSNSLSKQADVAKRLVATGESLVALARTPEQTERMEARLSRMKRSRDSLIARAQRLEGYSE